MFPVVTLGSLDGVAEDDGGHQHERSRDQADGRDDAHGVAEREHRPIDERQQGDQEEAVTDPVADLRPSGKLLPVVSMSMMVNNERFKI